MSNEEFDTVDYYRKNSAEVNERLGKALEMAAGSGDELSREDLEKEVTNTLFEYSPQLALMDVVKGKSNRRSFRRVTDPGSSGNAVGESGDTRETNSVYEKDEVKTKIVRRMPKVTGYAEDSLEDDELDLIGTELDRQIEYQAQDLGYYIINGNTDSNKYEFPGLDVMIETNRQNMHLGMDPVLFDSLKIYDDMIDDVNDRGGSRASFCFSGQHSDDLSIHKAGQHIPYGYDEQQE